jgi:hypothetical protein
MQDEPAAERMGSAGAEFAASLTWERTLPHLLIA